MTQSNQVYAWLETADLEHYEKQFHDLGVTKIKHFQIVTEENLKDDIKMKKLEIPRFLKLWQEEFQITPERVSEHEPETARKNTVGNNASDLEETSCDITPERVSEHEPETARKNTVGNNDSDLEETSCDVKSYDLKGSSLSEEGHLDLLGLDNIHLEVDSEEETITEEVSTKSEIMVIPDERNADTITPDASVSAKTTGIAPQTDQGEKMVTPDPNVSGKTTDIAPQTDQGENIVTPDPNVSAKTTDIAPQTDQGENIGSSGTEQTTSEDVAKRKRQAQGAASVDTDIKEIRGVERTNYTLLRA